MHGAELVQLKHLAAIADALKSDQWTIRRIAVYRRHFDFTRQEPVAVTNALKFDELKSAKMQPADELGARDHAIAAARQTEIKFIQSRYFGNDAVPDEMENVKERFIIYVDHEDMQQANKPLVNVMVHYLVSYCKQSVENYMEMAKTLQEDFPEASLAEIECFKVHQSSSYRGATIVVWYTKMKRSELGLPSATAYKKMIAKHRREDQCSCGIPQLKNHGKWWVLAHKPEYSYFG